MSVGVIVKPVVKAIYSINENLNIEGSFGYHFDLYSGPLSREEDLETYLRYIFFQSGMKTQWNGIRIGIGCSYNLL